MRPSAKIFFTLFSLFAAAFQTSGFQAVPQLRQGEVKVSADTLRLDVEFLSDTLCGGRACGSRGLVEASAYIMRRLSSMGLEVAVQGFGVDSVRTGHNILAVPAHAAPGPCSASELIRKDRPLVVLMASYDGLGTLGGRLYPGADSNASGVAALLSLASRLRGSDNIVFAFLDAHNAGKGGSEALRLLLRGRRVALAVNIDIVGAVISPVYTYWPDYLMALGAGRWSRIAQRCNSGLQLHLYYDYYRSRAFTDLFYRRAGEQAAFVEDGTPSIMFTSGITANTNKPSDTPDTLDYDIFSRRVEFIARFISEYGRK